MKVFFLHLISVEKETTTKTTTTIQIKSFLCRSTCLRIAVECYLCHEDIFIIVHLPYSILSPYFSSSFISCIVSSLALIKFKYIYAKTVLWCHTLSLSVPPTFISCVIKIEERERIEERKEDKKRRKNIKVSGERSGQLFECCAFTVFCDIFFFIWRDKNPDRMCFICIYLFWFFTVTSHFIIRFEIM